MHITRSGECGNSPKNAFVEDFIIDLIAGKDVADRLAQDAALPKMPWLHPTAVGVAHAISHGRVGAGNGTVMVEGTERAFAIVLEFANTKGDRVRDIKVFKGA